MAELKTFSGISVKVFQSAVRYPHRNGIFERIAHSCSRIDKYSVEKSRDEECKVLKVNSERRSAASGISTKFATTLQPGRLVCIQHASRRDRLIFRITLENDVSKSSMGWRLSTGCSSGSEVNILATDGPSSYCKWLSPPSNAERSCIQSKYQWISVQRIPRY